MRRSALLLLALATACGGASPTPTETTIDQAPGTTVVDAPATTTGADPLRRQLDWFVAAINGAPVTETEYEERFADDFRRAVPFEGQFMPVLGQLRDQPGEWRLVGLDTADPFSGVAEVAAGDERIRVSMAVEPDPPFRITGLLVQPAGLADPPETLAEAADRLAGYGTLRMLAAEVVDGACVPVHQVAASEPAPLGSVFKLYVLGAVADAVAAGHLDWDDEVVVRDELKSVPSGILQNEPAGTTRTVEEMATLMISISDNTATDHLIHLLGRETVEEELSDLGHASPELNIPFLTTRELTALKIGPASGLRVQYLGADVDRKRAILDQISDITPADLPVLDLTRPVEPDRLEWFASPEDLCRLMVELMDRAARPGLEPLATILSENPGVAPEPGTWDYLAFKGGSEPGLVAMTWLADRPDGRRFVLAGSVVNAERAIPELDPILLLAAARDLLARHP